MTHLFDKKITYICLLGIPLPVNYCSKIKLHVWTSVSLHFRKETFEAMDYSKKTSLLMKF